MTEDKTYPERNQQTDAMVKKYFKILEQVFRDYNIFDDEIMDICKNFLSNKEFTDYLF